MFDQRHGLGLAFWSVPVSLIQVGNKGTAQPILSQRNATDSTRRGCFFHVKRDPFSRSIDQPFFWDLEFLVAGLVLFGTAVFTLTWASIARIRADPRAKTGWHRWHLHLETACVSTWGQVFINEFVLILFLGLGFHQVLFGYSML